MVNSYGFGFGVGVGVGVGGDGDGIIHPLCWCTRETKRKSIELL